MKTNIKLISILIIAVFFVAVFLSYFIGYTNASLESDISFSDRINTIYISTLCTELVTDIKPKVSITDEEFNLTVGRNFTNIERDAIEDCIGGVQEVADFLNRDGGDKAILEMRE